MYGDYKVKESDFIHCDDIDVNAKDTQTTIDGGKISALTGVIYYGEKPEYVLGKEEYVKELKEQGDLFYVSKLTGLIYPGSLDKLLPVHTETERDALELKEIMKLDEYEYRLNPEKYKNDNIPSPPEEPPVHPNLPNSFFPKVKWYWDKEVSAWGSAYFDIKIVGRWITGLQYHGLISFYHFESRRTLLVRKDDPRYLSQVQKENEDKAKELLQNQLELEEEKKREALRDPILAIMPFVDESTIKSVLSVIEKDVIKEKLETVIYLKEAKDDRERLINILKNEETVNKILKNESILKVFQTNQTLYNLITHIKNTNTQNANNENITQLTNITENKNVDQTKNLITNNIVEAKSKNKGKETVAAPKNNIIDKKNDIQDKKKKISEREIIKEEYVIEEPDSQTEEATNHIVNNKVQDSSENNKEGASNKKLEVYDLFSGGNFLEEAMYKAWGEIALIENNVKPDKESVKSIASNMNLQNRLKVDPSTTQIKENEIIKEINLFTKEQEDYVINSTKLITNEIIQNVKTKNLITDEKLIKKTEESIAAIVKTELIKEIEKTKLYVQEEIEKSNSNVAQVSSTKENLKESKVSSPKNDIASNSNGHSNTVTREITNPRPYISDPGKFPLIGKKA